MKNRYLMYVKIVERARKEGLYKKEFNCAIMHIKRADRRFSLRLDDWNNANKRDFMCDFLGIVENGLARDFNGFVPLFTGNML